MISDSHLCPGVNQIAYFSKGFGIGESSCLMLETVKRAGIPVSLISVNDHRQYDDQSFPYQIDNTFKYPINFFTDIPHIPPFIQRHGWDLFKNRYNIGLVFWETSRASRQYLDAWSYLDEIWTTSRFMQDILMPIVSVPVYHIPQPLELNYSKRITNKIAAGITHGRFTFLFFFSFSSTLARKNPEAIIEAFQLAFPDKNHPVQLIIKSTDASLFPEESQTLQKKMAGDSRLIWIDQLMDEQSRFDLMDSCDCYISLHRSEGFGFTLAEAMLLGKPVIGTGYSGNMDYMNDDNSYLCSYRFVRVGKGNKSYPARGIWAEPNIDHAAGLMRRVEENREEAMVKGGKGRDFIQTHHNFNRVGAVITQRLASIQLPVTTKRKPWLYIKSRSYQKIVKIYHNIRKFI